MEIQREDFPTKQIQHEYVFSRVLHARSDSMKFAICFDPAIPDIWGKRKLIPQNLIQMPHHQSPQFHPVQEMNVISARFGSRLKRMNFEDHSNRFEILWITTCGFGMALLQTISNTT